MPKQTKPQKSKKAPKNKKPKDKIIKNNQHKSNKNKSVKTKQNRLKALLKKHHKVIIVAILLLALLVSISTVFIVNNAKENQKKINIATAEKASREKEANRIAADPVNPMGLLGAVNKLRSTKGLQPLTLVSNLEIAAQQGCADLIAGNYFDFTNPTTGKKLNTYMIDNIGDLSIKLGRADITKATTDKQTATEVMEARFNIAPALNTGTSNSIGIATCKAPTGGNDIYVVAMIAEINGGQPSGPATVQQPAQATPAPQKEFVAGVCTKTHIPKPPPITVVKDYMLPTDPPYYAQVGTEGYVHTCTPNSDGYKPDDVIHEAKPDQIWVGG